MLLSSLPSETTIATTDFCICNAMVSGVETSIKIKWSDLITALSLGGGGGSGAVVAVKQTQLTATFSTSSSTFVDTGLDVTYAPTSASNNILIMLTAYGTGVDGTTSIMGRLMRGSTPIGVGNSVGSRIQATVAGYNPDISMYLPLTMNWLDSPATTSSTTWSFQIQNQGSGTVVLNSNQSDSSSTTVARLVSTITIMEVTP